MKEITLTTGITERIGMLTIAQVDKVVALCGVDIPQATLLACLTSINKARGLEAPMTLEEFKEKYAVPEADELFFEIFKYSGMRMGEVTANP